MVNIDLTGKTAIVGGSSKGIGKSTAMELADSGASVILFARDKAKLQTLSKELDTSKGQNHEYYAIDYSNPSDVQSIISEITNHRSIHILINNTGGPPGGPAHKADLEEYRNAFEQHVICNQILTQAVIPGMQEANYGRIVNIISTSVKQPIPNLGVSNTIRGAVANWSKTLSMELAPFGITVNNVLPGATETDRLDGIIQNKVNKTGQNEDEVIKGMKEGIPARRFGKPEELAYTIIFLVSEYAGYINGVNLPVDGGRTGSL